MLNMMRKGNKVAFPSRLQPRNQGHSSHKSEDRTLDPKSAPSAPPEPPKDINSMSRIELLRAGLASQIQNNLQESTNGLGNDELKTDTKGSFKDAKKKVMFQDSTEDLD